MRAFRFVVISFYSVRHIPFNAAKVAASLAGLILFSEVRAAEVDLSKLPPPAKKVIDFIQDIQPILESRCYSCHGPDKQEDNLRWDTKSSALRISEPVIVPCKSAESRMIHLVGGLDPNLVMPKKGERLTPEQIGLLRAWIDQGAAWPPEVAVAKVKDKADWWSFKPATNAPLPKVRNKRWARNEIDLFILARLEAQNIMPSPEADRRTLIRRVSFDLTGLPPTPEEVENFLGDKSRDAYEKLVDRLLASPRYGERWARHWLDTVHYGETHGYDKDKPRLNAWPYRDYVIRSFNSDKTYSRFVEEQLAGDVLFPEEPDGIAALGFIAAGPWDFVGHVELPIEKSDGLIARYNDRDDMVMTTISTFQSLTVHCARCHNHKFDPILQKDYYSLQSVFAGVDRADRTFDPDKAVHSKRRALSAEKHTLEEQLAVLANTMAQVSSPELQAIDSQMKEINAKRGAEASEKSPSNGYHSGIEKTPDYTKWVQVDLGKPQRIDAVRLVPARPVDFPDTPGFGYPPRFQVEISNDPEFKKAELIADLTAGDFANPGDQPFQISVNAQTARFIRMTANKLWKRTDDYIFALAELQVFSGKTNVALGAEVTALDSIEAGLWSKKFLVDGFSSRTKLPNVLSSATEKHEHGDFENTLQALADQRANIVAGVVGEKAGIELSELKDRLRKVTNALASLPPSQSLYAATSAFTPNGNFIPAKTPRPVHLLARGDVKKPEDLMAPAGIGAVSGPDAHFEVPLTDEGARRAALAKWITDPKNMLTRRSIVNRVWHYHFGRGIVETPNDFGHMGALPSHPELLDWLAFWFVDNGESMKKLHRLIVTSATYRQSSSSDVQKPMKKKPRFDKEHRDYFPSAQYAPLSFFSAKKHLGSELDADNRLLWRMNRTRLDAESIRDSILFVSGKLDLAMGGPSVQQFGFKDDHSPVYDYTQFDPNNSKANRRSIYRFLVRSMPDPLMDSLDCPDASILTPKRNVTMTALQALSVLNDPFVLKKCEEFAARIAKAGDTEKQIKQAYVLALNRQPTRDEMKKLLPFAKKNGMTNFCRLLLNTSEFMFVD
ncbi:MAG: Protein of unknown function (DUF1553)/Protein of unknown function (DUF1549)/Planctomycete [Verrucomicrobiales bacterium]|nr:Protein of unknown function (DUF1553)/Protein of unknown function (DUF1549)/Planctomycete [Verrucomicrobiales bacterium]